MYRFNCDYLEGAHPEIIRRLSETNLQQTASYGADEYSERAREKIKTACQCPNAKVYFLVGGTQSNYAVLDSLLKNYEGVISADTGHINVHEAGAIEFSGHKILTIPAHDGKLDPCDVEKYLNSFYADGTYPHMVRPGAIYISHPSEYGTLYTKDQLISLRELCDRFGMKLYLDGARLGYGLAAENTDVGLPEIAKYCHAFYIGGTKVGALFGEAVVFTDESDGNYFFTEMKQHGALLAKGRILGLQFDTLFTDDLYFNIGRHAISLAMKIKREFTKKGYLTYLDSYTNQQFFILEESKLCELLEKVIIDDWGPMGAGKRLVRITTSWATTEEAVDYLISLI
ncbi:MAG: aminotransferase class V-fold PLP-dependent enzyme [Clostridia bacterium]|nr:aminotransferase class V-fold PLP-dependent enzyme [Clostridia bacterium]